MSNFAANNGVNTTQAGMRAAAQTFGSYQETLGKIMSQVQADVAGSVSVWSGDTSGVFRQKMDDWNSSVMQIINDLGTLEQKVVDSARAQARTDQANQDTVGSTFGRMTPTIAGSPMIPAVPAQTPSLPGI